MADDGELLKPPKSLQPPVRYEMPEDPVGTRPAGEKRAGPVRLLWLAVVALRFHLWRVLQFGLLAMLFALIPVGIVGFTAGLLMQADLRWAAHLTYIALWPVVVPLMAGCSHAVLLVIQGYRPPWYELVRPLLNLRLYGNVLAAGLPATALMWAASFGLMLAGAAERLGEIVGQEPWGTFLACLPPVVVSNLVALPFVFAALDAVTNLSPCGRSLWRNLRFAALAPGLLLAFGLLNIVVSALSNLASACMRTREAWLPEGALWFALVLFGGLAAALAFHVLLPPVFYREFVWRDREAADRSVP